MQCLKFSQKDGFALAPDPLSQDDGSWESVLTAAGYSKEVGALGEYGDEITTRVSVYRKGQTDEFLVDFNDYAGTKIILVAGEADLFALHLRLSALFLPQAESTLRDLHELASKAFRAWHGHDAGLACRQCDPVRHQQQTEALKRLRTEGCLRPKG